MSDLRRTLVGNKKRVINGAIVTGEYRKLLGIKDIKVFPVRFKISENKRGIKYEVIEETKDAK